MTDFFQLDPLLQAQRLNVVGRDALKSWDLQGASLELIKHRENAVFRVEKNGRRAALRIHRHGYHCDAELRSELQWMQALAESGITVPDVIPTTAGQLFVNYTGAGLPGELQIDLFEWVEGEQIGSVEAGTTDEVITVETYGAIGALAATVHNQAASWCLPEGFVRHAWDADGLAGEHPFWGEFWLLELAGKSEAELLKRGRDRVHRELANLEKSPSNYSMIHADFVPENIMVCGDRVRLIDFDDSGFGWHMFELATSLFFIKNKPYFEQARVALIEGYRKHRQLTDEELELLPLFFLARSFTYVGWVHTRPETETARELGPMLLASACELAEDYLSN